MFREDKLIPMIFSSPKKKNTELFRRNDFASSNARDSLENRSESFGKGIIHCSLRRFVLENVLRESAPVLVCQESSYFSRELRFHSKYIVLVWNGEHISIYIVIMLHKLLIARKKCIFRMKFCTHTHTIHSCVCVWYILRPRIFSHPFTYIKSMAA